MKFFPRPQAELGNEENQYKQGVWYFVFCCTAMKHETPDPNQQKTKGNN